MKDNKMVKIKDNIFYYLRTSAHLDINGWGYFDIYDVDKHMERSNIMISKYILND